MTIQVVEFSREETLVGLKVKKENTEDRWVDLTKRSSEILQSNVSHG